VALVVVVQVPTHKAQVALELLIQAVVVLVDTPLVQTKRVVRVALEL